MQIIQEVRLQDEVNYEHNATTSDKSEVSKWISDNDANVMDVSRLSKDDADAHLFKVCVEYKAKDTVLGLSM